MGLEVERIDHLPERKWFDPVSPFCVLGQDTESNTHPNIQKPRHSHTVKTREVLYKYRSFIKVTSFGHSNYDGSKEGGVVSQWSAEIVTNADIYMDIQFLTTIVFCQKQITVFSSVLRSRPASSCSGQGQIKTV